MIHSQPWETFFGGKVRKRNEAIEEFLLGKGLEILAAHFTPLNLRRISIPNSRCTSIGLSRSHSRGDRPPKRSSSWFGVL